MRIMQGSLFMKKSQQILDLLEKNREIKRDQSNLFFLDIEYDGDTGSALMKFYDPENDTIKYLHDQSNHKPYCLTPLKEETIRERVQKTLQIKEVKRHDLLEDKIKTMRKIIVPTPRDVGGRGGIRKKIGEENAYEAWIPYHLNYLFDRGLWPCLYYDIHDMNPVLTEVHEKKEELVNLVSKEEKELAKRYLPVFSEEIPKINFTAMDIEVEGEDQRIIQPKDAGKPVISVAFVSKRDDKEQKRVFLLKDEAKKKNFKNLNETGKGYSKTQITVNGEKVNVRVYENEQNLLLDVFIKIAETPLLLTFNGDAYDLYYLYERAQKLGIEKDYIPFYITAKGRLREAYMKIGLHIDMYKVFRNAALKTYVFQEKYDNVSLNEIASTLLGEEKVHTGSGRFEELKNLSLRELAVYNFVDSHLTAELFKYNDWIPLKILVALSRITRFPIREISRRGVSTWIENWIKAEHREKGYLIPNETRMNEREVWAEEKLRDNGLVPEAVSRDKKFRGGTVLEPKKGIWFNVYVPDFASLYPSVIKVHNISYETVLCPHEECQENKLQELPYWVCTKRSGIISKLVGLIRDVRVHYFKPLSRKTPKDQLTLPDVMQGALKVLINASYGVLGAKHFPFYEIFTAESVTSLGRKKIKRIANKAKNMNLKVLYGDTDSIFIHNPKKEEIEHLVEWSSKELKVDLEVDKIYRFLALSSRKKNYFGLLKNGETDVKGMIVKKRNTPPFLKKEFQNVTEILKKTTPDNLETIKKRLSKKIKNIVKKIDNREYDLQSLAFHTQISKPIEEYTKTTPQHVKAAKELELHGKKIKPGQIISYVKTKTEKGVKPLDYANPQKVNWNKYLEIAETAFDQLLDAFGLSFQRLKQDAKGVRKLSDFMK